MSEQPNKEIVKEESLTNWKNAPSLRDLKQDFEDAKASHDGQISKIGEWLDNLNIEGKAKIQTPKGNSAIVPKLIRKQAEWRYTALSEPFLSTDELFNVKPVTWEDREAAIQNQLVLNHQFNAYIDKTRFIDEYIRAAVDEGTAIVRLGWDFEEEEYTDNFPIVEYRVNPELQPMHEQLSQMQEESPSQYQVEVPEELKQAHQMSLEQGMPIEPVVIGYQEETRTRTIKNAPTVEVCDYRNLTIDPTCQGDLDKATFVVYSFESSMSDLKKDSKYKNLEKVNVSGNTILGQPDHATSDGGMNFNFNDQPRKKVVVHEYWGYWDIDGSGVVKPIVAAWVGDTLIRLEENPYPDRKVPFVAAQYLPVRRSVYGEPDGALLEDNQKIIGAVTRGMIDIMGKSANGQTGIRKDMLDTTNRRRFDKGQDYEFNINVDPRVGVFMHTYPEIPNSAQFMLQLQNAEAESLTGVKAFSQGISSQALGDVATGIRGALDAASKRELGILRRLSAGVVKIGQKIISMNKEFLSEEEVIRVTNEEFVTVAREELGGEFDLKLSISTAEEDDNKAQELAFMLQTMGNSLDFSLVQMILSDIARLRKMPDLAKKIEAFQPQPDPIEQEKAQLELELMKAQLEKTNAEVQQLMASAQLDASKVGTEQAKQGQIQSSTDQNTLDFVEQESGVKQERDLQKHGEQARSQAQLKLLDRQFQREDNQVDLVKEYIKSKNK